MYIQKHQTESRGHDMSLCPWTIKDAAEMQNLKTRKQLKIDISISVNKVTLIERRKRDSSLFADVVKTIQL